MVKRRPFEGAALLAQVETAIQAVEAVAEEREDLPLAAPSARGT